MNYRRSYTAGDFSTAFVSHSALNVWNNTESRVQVEQVEDVWSNLDRYMFGKHVHDLDHLIMRKTWLVRKAVRLFVEQISKALIPPRVDVHILVTVPSVFLIAEKNY